MSFPIKIRFSGSGECRCFSAVFCPIILIFWMALIFSTSLSRATSELTLIKNEATNKPHNGPLVSFATADIVAAKPKKMRDVGSPGFQFSDNFFKIHPSSSYMAPFAPISPNGTNSWSWTTGSGQGVTAYGWTTPTTKPWDFGHLLKKKFGTWFAATVVGVAGLVVFFQGFFGVKYPPQNVITTLTDIPYGQGHSGQVPTWNVQKFRGYSTPPPPPPTLYGHNIFGNFGGDPNGKAVIRHTRGHHSKSSKSNKILEKDEADTRMVQKFWRQVETCAEHAMCLSGKEESSRSKNQRNGFGVSSFGKILKTMSETQKGTENSPILPKLYKAFETGQLQDSTIYCSMEYKECPPKVAKFISKLVQRRVGKYMERFS